jgi:hypothetical protein
MKTAENRSQYRQDILAAALAVAAAAIGTAVIWLVTPWLGRFESTLLPDQGPAWYYWKLPNPDFWSRFTAWGGYALHQLAAWACIAWGVRRAAKAKAGERVSTRLVPPGLVFFAINLFFYCLHLGQTLIFYDGLAQDVSVFSSQASVVVMLVIILILMNDKRGLFFGRKLPMPAKAVAFIRKYHGYYFAWALIYTFWYHPMTSTVGHLAGFFYMLVLLAQGGLMFTRVHGSPRWAALLELLVLVHGATVAAVVQGSTMWTMFAFGFMFVATQLYGLRLPRWGNVAFTLLFAAAALAVYSGWLVPGKSIDQIHQILWIPAIEYLLVPVFLAIGMGGAWIAGRLRPKTD